MRISLVKQAKRHECYMYVGAQRLSKTNANKNDKTDWGNVNPGQICLGPQGWVMRVSLVEQAKRNESYLYVSVQRLSKTIANIIWDTRLRESKPRSKIFWVHKAECWKSVWSSRSREMNPICMLVLRGWMKQMPLIFENPVWVKVNPGQNLFESTGLINENQFG